MRIKPIKPIFMLWFQGWGAAPRLVKQCVRSWRKYNPEWQVVLLDCHTLPAWVEWRRGIAEADEKSFTKAGASDLIRLALLRKFGGVWADATTFCCQPLASWLPNDDFFAFDNDDTDKHIASWFLSASYDSTILDAWHDETQRYWSNRKAADEYFWFHKLFAKLCKTDETFADVWSRCLKVPSLEAHFFHRHGFEGTVDQAVVDHVENIRSPVYKLTHRKGAIDKGDRLKYLFEFHFNQSF